MRFDLARADDDFALRKLLRETPMGGSISIGTEREPSFFAACAVEGPEHQTLVARRVDGTICALATRSVRMRFVNGEPRRVAYLGSLRLANDVRGNGRLVIAGFRALRELCDGSPTFTSILSDNAPARRLLESGRGGLPIYECIGEMVTLVMRVRRVRRGRRVAAGAFEPHKDQRLQLAPVWGESDSFFAKPQAAGVVRDLRGVRQSVVRSYSPALARWRRWINLCAAVTGRPRLPAVGEPLRLGFASHLAAGADQVVPMLWMLHDAAAARGLDYLVAGFDARDERLNLVRRWFGGRELRSRLYAVNFPQPRAALVDLDDRLLQPEVALL